MCGQRLAVRQAAPTPPAGIEASVAPGIVVSTPMQVGEARPSPRRETEPISDVPILNAPTCPRCGAPTEPRGLFCADCGFKLQTAPTATEQPPKHDAAATHAARLRIKAAGTVDLGGLKGGVSGLNLAKLESMKDVGVAKN